MVWASLTLYIIPALPRSWTASGRFPVYHVVQETLQQKVNLNCCYFSRTPPDLPLIIQKQPILCSGSKAKSGSFLYHKCIIIFPISAFMVRFFVLCKLLKSQTEIFFMKAFLNNIGVNVISMISAWWHVLMYLHLDKINVLHYTPTLTLQKY